jgi:hypothetical protein
MYISFIVLGEAIQKLRETEEMLNKKQDFLGRDSSSGQLQLVDSCADFYSWKKVMVLLSVSKLD